MSCGTGGGEQFRIIFLNKHTDIADTRLNWHPGRFSENSLQVAYGMIGKPNTEPKQLNRLISLTYLQKKCCINVFAKHLNCSILLNHFSHLYSYSSQALPIDRMSQIYQSPSVPLYFSLLFCVHPWGVANKSADLSLASSVITQWEGLIT